MGLTLARVLTAAMLVASGTLLCAASWQRWAGACVRDDVVVPCSELRQDHLYDFLLPSEPWEPVGTAAQLAGVSVVLAALALPGLLIALPAGRRTGPVTVLAVVVAVLAALDVGTATLRSGLDRAAVAPLTDDLALSLWLLVPFGLLVRLGVAAFLNPGPRVRAIGAVVLLALGSPLVAAFSYAIGPYDAAPWWEAVMGVFTAAGGLCVLLTVVPGSTRPRDRAPQAAVAGWSTSE